MLLIREFIIIVVVGLHATSSSSSSFFVCKCSKKNLPRAKRKPLEKTNASSISCSRSLSDKLLRCWASWKRVCLLLLLVVLELLPVVDDGVGFLLGKIVAVFSGGGGDVDSSDEAVVEAGVRLHAMSGGLADDSGVVSASEASNKAFLWL